MLPNDYHTMNMASLVDLLARETEKFTQLMAEKKFGDDYDDCKEKIKNIQTAIHVKKETLQEPSSAS